MSYDQWYDSHSRWKTREGFPVSMLRKSKAFACTKGGESRFFPFKFPHRAVFSGNRWWYDQIRRRG